MLRNLVAKVLQPRIAGMGAASQGRSVRYNPGEAQAARSANQQELQRLLTPAQNPSVVVADRMDEIAPNGIPSSALISSSRPGGISTMGVFNPDLRTQPEVDSRIYDYLHQRATSGKIDPGFTVETESPYYNNQGEHDIVSVPVDPVFQVTRFSPSPVINSAGFASSGLVDEERINAILDNEKRGATFPLNLREPHAIMQVAVADNIDSPGYALGHEMSHNLLEHTTNRSDIPKSIQESEAGAAGYGITNRMYPWQRKNLEHAANYALSDKSSPFGFSNLGQAQHLRDPEIVERINSVVQKVVPVPRKPLANVVPDFWAEQGRPNRSRNIPAGVSRSLSPTNVSTDVPVWLSQSQPQKRTGINTSATVDIPSLMNQASQSTSAPKSTSAPMTKDDYLAAQYEQSLQDRQGRYGY
jgi:hypothetical protein